MILEDYLHCSEYEDKALHASEAGFSAFYDEATQRHFFVLLDADGKALLKSEGYPQQAARENGIQSVIKNRANREFYSVKSYDNGRYYMSLRAANYREIARSCSADSEAGALALLSYLTGEEVRSNVVATTAAVAEPLKERADNKVDDDYLICKEYAGHEGVITDDDFNGLVKFTHSNGKHYFAWYGENGEVLMRSEGYPTTAARDNGMASVNKNRDDESKYSTLERMGRHFVILKAGNHQEIARSCPYDSQDSAMALYPMARAGAKRASLVAEETTSSDRSVEYAAVATAVAAPLVAESITTDAPVVNTETDVEDDYLPCREYENRNVNDKMNNVALFKHENGQYYFAIYNADGRVRLRSEGFRMAQERDVELSGVLKNLNNDAMYSTIRRGDYYIKVLKDKTGREVGRSCLQKDEIVPVAEPIVEVAAVAAVASAVIAPIAITETVVADVEDDYLACREYEGHAITDAANNVALFKHSDDQYYFAVYNADGSVRIRSEGFRTDEDRSVELTSALTHLNSADMYTILRRGEYYLQVLKDEYGKEVGRGCLQKDIPVPPPPPVVEAAPIVAAAVLAATAAVVVKPTPPPAPVVSADVEDDYLPCSDYEGHSINDKVNNVAMFKHSNGQYYFTIYNTGGSVRLRSEGFRTAQDRDKELSGALKNLNNPDMYTTIRRGDYYISVLKDKTGREVGRSCMQKEEPKAVIAPIAAPVAAAAVAAVAAAATIIPTPEPVKKVVETFTPPPPVYKAAAPVVEEAAVAASGFKWWWLLLPLLALLAWYLWGKGCNKEVVAPSVTSVPVVPPPPVETAPVPVAVAACAACTASSDDAIFTSVCANPKKLSRLGTNPEFGNSHGLSPEAFYNKLKKAYSNNNVDKVFLDKIYKAMGYAGFADAKPAQFSAVTLPVGATGRLGYSKEHKTGCYTLPDDEHHRLAFRLESANGCHLHFMKTCGNHFFFCPN